MRSKRHRLLSFPPPWGEYILDHRYKYYYECPSYLFAFKRQNWNQNQIELQELYVKFSFELEAIIHLFIYTHGTDHFLAQSYYIYFKKGAFSWICILNRLLSVNVYAHSHAQEILGYTVLCIKLSIKRWCCGSSPLQHLFVFLAVSNMSIIQNICWRKVLTYTSHNNFLCLKSEYHLHWFKLFKKHLINANNIKQWFMVYPCIKTLMFLFAF